MADVVLGWRPVVACTQLHDPNDPAPANALRRFGVSHDPWIVAVNMVSEGVDIPRLRSVVYLTNRLTLLSFRQIVGRVVRTDPANKEDQGRVYLPADPRLIAMATTVTEEAKLLPPPLVIVADDGRPQPVRIEDRDPRQRVPFETLRTIAEQGGVFDTSGLEVDSVLVECARRFIDREHLTGTDPESLAIAASDKPDLKEALLKLRDTP